MDRIESFFEAKTFAVAGASIEPHKYGNQVFRALLLAKRETYPLNPKRGFVEGHQAYAKLAELPVVPESLSIITPPEVTRQVVDDAISIGVSTFGCSRELRMRTLPKPHGKQGSM